MPIDCSKYLLVAVSSLENAQYKRATAGSVMMVSTRSLLLSLLFLLLTCVQSPSANNTGTEEERNGYSKGLPPCKVCSRSGSGNPESIVRNALSGSSVCKDEPGLPQSGRGR